VDFFYYFVKIIYFRLIRLRFRRIEGALDWHVVGAKEPLYHRINDRTSQSREGALMVS